MTILIEPPDWSDAACAGMSPDLFFPERGGDAASYVRRARAICAGCPIRIECLDYAIANREEHGIWGGRTFGKPSQKYRGLIKNEAVPILTARAPARVEHIVSSHFTSLPGREARQSHSLVTGTAPGLAARSPGAEIDSAP